MSSSFENMLKRLVKEFSPTTDTDDPLFISQVVEPMRSYVGDDQTWPSTRGLIEDRLAEEFPSLDQTVFADLFAKPLSAVIDPLLYQIRTMQGKRDLVNSPYLMDRDLNALSSNFLTERGRGSRAVGEVRVYFSAPRPINYGYNTLLRLNTGGSTLSYYVTSPTYWSAAELSSQKEGNLYFVDVTIAAGEPGDEYNLARGEASQLEGFTGASRVTNFSPIEGGRDADDQAMTIQNIRQAISYRGLSTRAAVDFLLPSTGVTKNYVSTPGDDFLIRDRVFFSDPELGPDCVVWIPGGLLDSEIPAGTRDYLSLGIAYDIWVRTESYSTRKTFKITGLRDLGAELLSAGDGKLFYQGTFDTGFQFKLEVEGRRFHPTERVALDRDHAALTRTLRPLSVGDIVEVEGVLTYDGGAPGSHVKLIVTSVDSDTEISLVRDPLDQTDPLEDQTSWTAIGGSEYRVLRPSQDIYRGLVIPQDTGTTPYVVSSAELDPFTIPLSTARAYADGEVVTSTSGPALPTPHTYKPEVGITGGARITENIVSEVDGFPLLTIERVELSGSGGNPEYSYPRWPLFVEVADVGALRDSNGAALPLITVRTHLLGPMDFGWTSNSCMENLGPAAQTPAPLRTADGHTLRPLHAVRGMLLGDPDDPSPTDTVFISSVAMEWDGPLTASHSLFTNSDEYILLLKGGGAPGFEVPPRYLPVKKVTRLDATNLKVELEREDILASYSGEVVLLPGTTRKSCLNRGRSPEGTYFFDTEMVVHDVDLLPSDISDKFATGQRLIPTSPLAFFCGGFEILSPIPGLQFSAKEQPSLFFDASEVCGEVLDSGEITVHSIPADQITELQRLLESGEDKTWNPIVPTGLFKQLCPSFVVLSLVFESQTIGADEVARIVLESISSQSKDGRIELSDVSTDLYARGVTYVLFGRTFSLTINQNRQYISKATKAAVSSLLVGEFVISSITARRIKTRSKGEVVDETDSSNFIETAVLRPGGYSAD